MLLRPVMQRRSKTRSDQRFAELYGESFAFLLRHILAGEKNRKTVEVVTILLRLGNERPFLQKAVFYRIVVNRDNEIGLALVRRLYAFNEADIADPGID